MWKKKIKQKKSQYIMIGLIVMLSSIIIGACSSLMLESSRFIDSKYETMSTDSIIIKDPSKLDEILDIYDNNNIEVDEIAKYKTNASKLIDKDGNNLQVISSNIILDNKEELRNFEGKELTDDTVWVSTAFLNDNKLEIGDYITFTSDNVKLKIVGTYEALFSPTITSGLQEYIVNENTFNKFNEESGYRLFITNNNKDVDTIAYLEKHLDKEQYKLYEDNASLVTDKKGMIAAVRDIPSLTGSIGAITGFIVFIATLVLINVIIKNSILQDFKTIGSYKAMGFSNKTIINSYIKSYLAVSVIFMILGSLLALPVGYYLANLNFTNMIGFSLTSMSVICNVVITIVLLILLYIDILKITNRIKKIAPVDAFRIGNTSSKKKLKKSFIKGANTPLQCAINELVRYKMKTITTIMIFIISMVMTAFFIGIHNSVEKMGENSGPWFMVAHDEVMVSGKINLDDINDITNDKDVANSLYGTFDLQFARVASNDNKASNEIMILFNSDTSSSQFSYNTGRAPIGSNEIAVGTKALKDNNLTVGDYVEITINNNTDDYLISGSYDSMMNGGSTLFASTQVIEDKNLDISYDYIALDIKDGVDIEQFKTEINDKYINYEASEHITGLQISVELVSTTVSPVCFALAILVIMFALINIFNNIYTYVNENRKNFGILKAFGYTSSYIRRKIIIKVLVMLMIAALISTVIYFTTSELVFYAMLGVNGYLYDINLYLIIIAGIMALATTIAYILSKLTNKVSPSELMEE